MKISKKIGSGGEIPEQMQPTKPKPPRLRRITLRVTVPCFEYRTTKQAANALADGGLAEVLAAFVSDWATAEERPGSWEADRVNAWLASHPWEKKERMREAWLQARQAREEARK